MSRCEVERRVQGGLERSDLSVVAAGTVVFCGELRLPDHTVASPWHPDNLGDAINKATNLGARWAFTSDATTLVLIDCSRTGPAITRVVGDFPLIRFSVRSELDSEQFLDQVHDAWARLIRQIAPVISGVSVPPGMSPDELFINSLRAVLTGPVAAIRENLNARRIQDDTFAHQLVTWMVDDQGWTHVPELWEDEVLRAARLTAYVFATRLLFYEALRRSRPELAPFSLPEVPASVAQATAEAYFKEARLRSGDYETLFDWDTGAVFALGADECVPLWQRVVQHLASFDLTKIGYDILGRMFERLIDPHERYRWGQHYTNPDVVDLMLSFAIPDGEGAILDPAAGGGTFLVRAYARKKALLGKTHQEILSDLYGVDVSAFAASLATVNLAVRQLDFIENYPQVALRSFFQLEPLKPFMDLPSPERVALGDHTAQPLNLKPVRAVVSNPPYVRIHELGSDRQEEAQRSLRVTQSTVPLPTKLHGLSNYHVYFWLHGSQFLDKDGRLVIIAAGEWLDSDYGAVLQKWLLENFIIECVMESLAEPWFSEARVGTVVVVARLCEEEKVRMKNLVKFVLLRKSLRELYGHAATDLEHFANVDKLRDRIHGLVGSIGEGEDLDWSSVSQTELWRLGAPGSGE